MVHIGLSREEINRISSLIAKLDAQPLSDNADRRVHPRIDFAHAMWLNLPTEPGAPWVHIFSRNPLHRRHSPSSPANFSTSTSSPFHAVLSHELQENTPLLVLAKVCFCRNVEMDVQEVGLAFTAVEYDPERTRHVPARWMSMVLQSDWLARRKAAITPRRLQLITIYIYSQTWTGAHAPQPSSSSPQLPHFPLPPPPLFSR